jgi:VCBS repeat-containing protein
MQKNMFKTLSIFTLALLVMSLTGAAATSTVCKANADKFSFSSTKYTGTVLTNDQGTNIKVISITQCTNGGKVTMKSNGTFSYKANSCFVTGNTINDSFTYTIIDKFGQKSKAKVTISYKCH